MKGKLKKKLALSLLAVTMLLGLGACGNQGNSDNQGIDAVMMIQSEREEYLFPEERDSAWRLLSSQYYHGEAIQFWGVKTIDENSANGLDIYLYQADGTGELIFSNVSTKYQANWFLDEDGNYFILQSTEVTKVDKAGNAFYRKPIVDGFFVDICQLDDGSIMLLKRTDSETMKLIKLDSDSGEMTEIPQVVLGEDSMQYIAAFENGLLLLNAEGIWEVNIKDGSKTNVLDFSKNSYEFRGPVSDFCLNGEGQADFLRSGELEKINLVDVSEGKTVIVVRNNIHSSYMYDYAYQFNAASDKYYVILEARDEETSLTDYRDRTNIEIGTGGGPDIICYDVLNETTSFIEKGVFEELSPYLKSSGYKEEDFFPAAFGFWKIGDEIYAANMLARTRGLWISEELLGGHEAPDIETLVNALLDYEEQACFKTAWEAEQVLDYFLAGSENLWDMVDWEKGTCDFSGELFAKMMEAAKRFGYDAKKAYPALAEFRSDSFYQYETYAKMMSEGKVPVGYIFEDGCYPAIHQTGVMAINSNSDEAHKQGAWAFISYMLSEEIQTSIHISTYPVSKAAFEQIAAREIEEGVIVETIGADGTPVTVFKTSSDWPNFNGDKEAFKAVYDLTEEKAAEIRELLEKSRPLPTNTTPIRSIILEEAAEYFYGNKSIGEVVTVIENRVKLYLDENS